MLASDDSIMEEEIDKPWTISAPFRAEKRRVLPVSLCPFRLLGPCFGLLRLGPGEGVPEVAEDFEEDFAQRVELDSRKLRVMTMRDNAEYGFERPDSCW